MANVTALKKWVDLEFSSILVLLFSSMDSLSGSIVSLPLAKLRILSTPSVSHSLLHSGVTVGKVVRTKRCIVIDTRDLFIAMNCFRDECVRG